ARRRARRMVGVRRRGQRALGRNVLPGGTLRARSPAVGISRGRGPVHRRLGRALSRRPAPAALSRDGGRSGLLPGAPRPRQLLAAGAHRELAAAVRRRRRLLWGVPAARAPLSDTTVIAVAVAL